MAKVIFLGTASATPSAEQDNTSLLVESNGLYLMIDCSGNPFRKLLQLDIPRDSLQHVLISHHHIDHMYALPSLVETLWIEGRSLPLHIHALASSVPTIEALLDLWDLRSRKLRHFPIEIHPIEGHENELVLDLPEFVLRTTPTAHALPSVATKLIFPNGKTFVYSSDTAPCRALIDFAKGSNYLVLECTYCDVEDELAQLTGHTRPSQFAMLADTTKAGQVFLVHHTDTEECSSELVVSQIMQRRKTGSSQVYVPRDLESLEIE